MAVKVMPKYEHLDILKSTIEDAIDSGLSVRDEAEDKAQRLTEIVSALDKINSDLEDNKSTLDSIQENLDASETQTNEAEDLGVYP